MVFGQVTPQDAQVSAVNLYEFEFKLSLNIPAGGYISITFPEQDIEVPSNLVLD